MTSGTRRADSILDAPGPRGLPIVGSLFDAWRDAIDLFMRATREHGDVVKLRVGPYDYVFLNDPDAIRHVLVENPKNYVKSRNYRGLKAVLGEGLVTSEGELWRRQRKLAQPAFHRERLASFVSTMVADTQKTLDEWSALPAGHLFDAHHEMMRLTFRIVGHTLFSTDVDDHADALGPVVTAAIHGANDEAEAAIPLPLWVPTPGHLRLKRAIGRLDDLVYRIVGERRRMGTAAPQDLLAMLMAARDDETNAQMNDKQLRDEVLTLALAGHETTANAMTYTLYLLSKHPEVARRLHAEVDQVLGGGRAPALEDLKRLDLTRRIVEESMRLYPPAWAFERQALEEDAVLGWRIPKGAIVGICTYALHRHPAHWPNPEGFDPDRFLPERAEGRHRYAYLPFGAGPRQCIGNGFAMMEAQLCLAMIAQRFAPEVAPGYVLELEPTVTMRPKAGMPMHLRSRQCATSPRAASRGAADARAAAARPA